MRNVQDGRGRIGEENREAYLVHWQLIKSLDASGLKYLFKNILFNLIKYLTRVQWLAKLLQLPPLDIHLRQCTVTVFTQINIDRIIPIPYIWQANFIVQDFCIGT